MNTELIPPSLTLLALQRQADSERLLGRRFTNRDWLKDPHLPLSAEVLDITGNQMQVKVHTRHGHFFEVWNLAHFEHGLATGFYQDVKDDE